MSQPGEGDWSVVEAAITRIIEDAGGAFSAETVAQIREFVQLARGRCPVPEVGKGYWATMRFMWPETADGPLEIEIFQDHLEVYRFHDQRTEIRHVAHTLGEPFTSELTSQLPSHS
jgi:hypothetical protein